MTLCKTDRLALGGFLIICSVLFLAVLWFTGGHLVYSLDDPYIHLALAENLPFHHGINGPPYFNSPSSSVLYPYLLMPLAHTSLAFAAPLLINLVAGMGCILMLVRLERQIDIAPSANEMVRAGMVVVFAGIINLFTLVFAGMEHTLHVLAVLVILSGLLEKAEGRALSVWFWIAIVVEPALRYEALAFSFFALLCVSMWSEWRRAVPAFVLMFAGPVGYGLYLQHLGLPFLPSSILVKSPTLAVTDDGQDLFGIIANALINITRNLRQVGAWVFLMLMVSMIALLFKPGTGRARAVVAVVVLTGCAHMVMSSFGWMDRYQAYLLALTLLVILYAGRVFFQRFAAHSRNGHFTLGLALLGIGFSSLACTFNSPASARDVYLMNAQLQRFVVDYWKQPIGTFDIGYISWQNPYTVLDLYGLASEDMRRINMQPGSPELLVKYLAVRGIDLAVMGRNFDPAQFGYPWKRVARIRGSGRHIIATQDQTFYVTNLAREAEAREALVSFGKTLPQGATLEVY